jgi:hypothetical protein
MELKLGEYNERKAQSFNNPDAFPDYKITFTSDNGSLHIHRHILCENSEYFTACLNSGMMESQQDVYECDEVQTEIFIKLIQCFYTSTLQLESTCIVPALVMASKYQFENIEQTLLKYLEKNTTPAIVRQCVEFQIQDDKPEYQTLVGIIRSTMQKMEPEKLLPEEYLHLEYDVFYRLMDTMIYAKSYCESFSLIEKWVNEDKDRREQHTFSLLTLVNSKKNEKAISGQSRINCKDVTDQLTLIGLPDIDCYDMLLMSLLLMSTLLFIKPLLPYVLPSAKIIVSFSIVLLVSLLSMVLFASCICTIMLLLPESYHWMETIIELRKEKRRSQHSVLQIQLTDRLLVATVVGIWFIEYLACPAGITKLAIEIYGELLGHIIVSAYLLVIPLVIACVIVMCLSDKYRTPKMKQILQNGKQRRADVVEKIHRLRAVVFNGKTTHY